MGGEGVDDEERLSAEPGDAALQVQEALDPAEVDEGRGVPVCRETSHELPRAVVVGALPDRMKKWSPASQTSPPSTVPGASMRRSSGKSAASASAIAAASPSRLGAPGRVSTAPRPVITAVSSTNVESGNRGSAGKRVSARPQSSSARQ